QLTVVFGVLGAQIAHLLIAVKVADGATAEMILQSWNGQYGWRWMFTAVTAPSLLFFIGSLLVPESPRWLIKNGKLEPARRILAKIGGQAYADIEAADIQNTISSEEVQHVRFSDLLVPKMRKILLVGIALAVLQQWSGINVLFNYAEEIYRSAGYGVNDIMFNIVITGAISLVFTLLAISMVDRFGRRILMLIGCAGIGLSHVLIGASYVMKLKGLAVLLFTLSALGCYSLSLAPITWVLISEIFPNRIRGAAISVAVSALWIACFILTYTFPILNGALGTAKTFWLYAAICFAGFFFVFTKVPETKGKSLEQIERELVD
ncbi:MAG: MFS transporter, partial [Kiritimatiellales bacterium]